MIALAADSSAFFMGRNPNATVFTPHSEIALNFNLWRLHYYLP
jgi:hypothetical protein